MNSGGNSLLPPKPCGSDTAAAIWAITVATTVAPAVTALSYMQIMFSKQAAQYEGSDVCVKLCNPASLQWTRRVCNTRDLVTFVCRLYQSQVGWLVRSVGPLSWFVQFGQFFALKASVARVHYVLSCRRSPTGSVGGNTCDTVHQFQIFLYSYRHTTVYEITSRWSSLQQCFFSKTHVDRQHT